MESGESKESFGDIAEHTAKSALKLVPAITDSTKSLLETGVNLADSAGQGLGNVVEATGRFAMDAAPGLGSATGELAVGVSKSVNIVSTRAAGTLGEGIGIMENIFRLTNTYIEGYNAELKYRKDKELIDLIEKDKLTKEKWYAVFKDLKGFKPESLIDRIEGDENKQIKSNIKDNIKIIIDFILYERLINNKTSIKHILGAGYVIDCIKKILEMEETPPTKEIKIVALKNRVTKPDWWIQFRGWALGQEVRWGPCREHQASLGGSKKNIKKKRRKSRKTRNNTNKTNKNNKTNKTKKSVIKKNKNKKTNRRKKSK